MSDWSDLLQILVNGVDAVVGLSQSSQLFDAENLPSSPVGGTFCVELETANDLGDRRPSRIRARHTVRVRLLHQLASAGHLAGQKSALDAEMAVVEALLGTDSPLVDAARYVGSSRTVAEGRQYLVSTLEFQIDQLLEVN